VGGADGDGAARAGAGSAEHAHATREGAILAAALDPIITIDAYGIVQSASESVERVFGWRAGELVGRNISVLMPEPHRSGHDGYLAAYRRTGRTNILGRTREFECVRRDGEVFPVEISVSRVAGTGDGSPLFVGIIRDISARRRLERELSLMRDLALAVSGASDLVGALVEVIRCIIRATSWDYGEVWTPSPGGEVLEPVASWSPQGTGSSAFHEGLCRARFRRGEGLPGRAWATGRAFRVEDVQALGSGEFCRHEAAREAGFRAAAVVPVLAGADAVAILVFFSRAARREDDALLDTVRASVAPLAPLFQRKRAEEALRESEQRLRWALRAAHGSSWEWEVGTGTVRWSPGMYEMWGVAPERPMDLESCLALVHEDDRRRAREAMERAVERREDYHCELRIRHAARGVRWMANHGRLVLDTAGRPVRMLCISLDITDRRGIEEELARHRDELERLVAERTAALRATHERLQMADRLASIGTLAAGLGHDMNNVLLPVRAHLNALLARGASRLPAAARRHVEAVRKSAAYLQQLADGLHYLATNPGMEEGSGEATDLWQWWSRAGPMISKAVPKHVRVRVSIPRGLPPVGVSAAGLTQAVLNLVVNAGEAIPAARKRVQGYVRIEAAEARGMVRLSVADNGTGMTEEVRRRAFEMFFSTKPRGLGTGLGLPLVRKVVESAGGSLAVDSAEGRGTTITLVLPPARQGRAAGRAVAVVTAADGRAGALARQLLEASGAAARLAGEPGDADVWIAEPAPGLLPAGAAWRARRPNGRLILLGEAARDGAAWRALRPETTVPPGDLGALREAIGRALAPQ
jgi:PAS domain S-box-containing protein